MEIMIPVTMVLKLEKQKRIPNQNMLQRILNKKSIKENRHQQQALSENQGNKNVKKSVKWQIPQDKEENQLNLKTNSQLKKQNKFELKFLKEQQQNFKRHHEGIQCQLQKKSTRSSLHDIQGHQHPDEQNQSQLSYGNIVTQKQMTNLSKKTKNQNYVKFQSDVLNQPDQKYCKICLQQGQTNLLIQSEKNLLAKVCKCHDYVHINCLQEWINHRDILNEKIQPNQCQVCKQSYSFELNTQKFFSFKILKKNFRIQPFIVMKQFLLSFFFFIISVFGLYLLTLFALSSQNGGRIRQVLGMPYVTCLTIIIFLLFIVILVCGIFTYNFIIDFCLDFKYKIEKIIQQQQSSRNLKIMFTEWK